MTGFRFSQATRRFILWTARVALVVYLVQILAIDHWRAHPADILGVDGTSAHIAHCHGAGDCSDGGTVAVTASANVAQMPVPPPAIFFEAQEQDAAPAAAYIAMPYEPPRAA